MPEPTKNEPKKAKKPEDPRVAAARERLASLNSNRSGTPKTTSQFLKETVRELKLTTWPDNQTLRKSTGVVLAFIVAAAVFTGAIDFFLTRLTTAIFPH